LRLGKIYTGKRANEQQWWRSEGITEKMTFRKYDPVVRKHVEFKEAKIK
jgi:ribosomal protein L33